MGSCSCDAQGTDPEKWTDGPGPAPSPPIPLPLGSPVWTFRALREPGAQLLSLCLRGSCSDLRPGSQPWGGGAPLESGTQRGSLESRGAWKLARLSPASLVFCAETNVNALWHRAQNFHEILFKKQECGRNFEPGGNCWKVWPQIPAQFWCPLLLEACADVRVLGKSPATHTIGNVSEGDPGRQSAGPRQLQGTGAWLPQQ